MSLARELGIKKGACSRLTKELANYAEEAKTTAEKVASMRAAGEAPHDVKHAVSFKELGNRMIDGKRRRRPVSRFFSFSLNLFSLSSHSLSSSLPVLIRKTSPPSLP